MKATSVNAPPTVATRQLVLRAPSLADTDELFEIQGNRQAMRNTYVAPNREATARYLEAYASRFPEDGFAPWTAVLQCEDRIIGWGGLNKDPKAPEYGTEVSYFLHPGYWGRGLATELVDASLRLAFLDLGLSTVSAFTRPVNHASRRVLEKTGFAFERFVSELGRDQYRVDAKSWTSTRGPAERPFR